MFEQHVYRWAQPIAPGNPDPAVLKECINEILFRQPADDYELGLILRAYGLKFGTWCCMYDPGRMTWELLAPEGVMK